MLPNSSLTELGPGYFSLGYPQDSQVSCNQLNISKTTINACKSLDQQNASMAEAFKTAVHSLGIDINRIDPPRLEDITNAAKTGWESLKGAGDWLGTEAQGIGSRASSVWYWSGMIPGARLALVGLAGFVVYFILTAFRRETKIVVPPPSVYVNPIIQYPTQRSFDFTNMIVKNQEWLKALHQASDRAVEEKDSRKLHYVEAIESNVYENDWQQLLARFAPTINS